MQAVVDWDSLTELHMQPVKVTEHRGDMVKLSCGVDQTLGGIQYGPQTV